MLFVEATDSSNREKERKMTPHLICNCRGVNGVEKLFEMVLLLVYK